MDEIRRKAALHGGWIEETILSLCDDLEETRAALEHWRGGEAARDLFEACRQLREVHAENERLKERIHALEGSAECAVAERVRVNPLDEPIAHLAALLFDEEELRNG